MNLVRKSLDNIEVYQHNYGNTNPADVEEWLNVGEVTGYTAGIVGWMGNLGVAKDGVPLIEVANGAYLVRTPEGEVDTLPSSLVIALWGPAS